MKQVIRKVFKFIGVVMVGLISLLGLFALYQFFVYEHENRNLLEKYHVEPSVLEIDGKKVRDLNKNGRLDLYEDSRMPVDARVEDLMKQMTLEEKAGTMFVSMAGIGKKGSLFSMPSPFDPQTMVLSSNIVQVLGKNISSVNIQVADARDIAVWNNQLQKLASMSRLGIPVTIASDPRHAFSFNPLAGFGTEGFSRWPEPIGFGALGDTSAVREFAAIAAREYRAVGIRLALHPMADLATEPRWPRINGTFGEDAYLTAALVGAYIRGFQGDSIGQHPWPV
jgi:beta-glucosidase